MLKPRAFKLLVQTRRQSTSAPCRRPSRSVRSAPAELLGKLSYSIYLTHKLLLGLMGWIYLRAHAAALAHAQTYAALLCIALTIPIATAAYVGIEVPGRRWLRALFEAKHPRIESALAEGIV
jgi:peptidoglycan/LPS O-acetylase OafA/YrhL